ncbi:DNA repair exonuclease SbcCD nuclease subunit [Granulicatella balaenopterae]|uniref:DNA repair exonuclease SbcCD nuclease subunit n=1 Tax=Granulicatella balaenopterae TaxID=137733 RepID=A0A1H9JTQ1_9LACT|nr:DNA repair exonuclease [Granulicatella balaenopterae]SEQ90286.1 DNA repair exonuclease SbcCD nuclease subunit [Granulicatella balaenopterae]
MVRFIHTADNHLGTPFVGLGTKNKQMAKKAMEASYEAFETVITTAINEQVDFVIIAGDLYDSSQQHIKELVFVNQQFSRLEEAGIPVYLSQGNHDFEQSFQLQLPQNVYLYDKKVASITHTTSKGEVVTITGFSYPTRWVMERMVEQFPTRNPEADYHIGMYHGYYDGSTADTGHYAPFSIREMQEKNYDYWALGHIHKRQVLSQTPPIVYSGNTQGFKRSELGEKGAYLVTLRKEQAPELEFFKTSSIEWMEVTCSLKEQVTLDDVLHTMAEALQNALIGKKDIQLISLTIKDYHLVEQNVLKSMAESDFIEAITPQLRNVLGQHYIYKVRLLPLTAKKLWPKQESLEQSFEDSLAYFSQKEHYQKALDDLFMQAKFTQEFSDWRNQQELMDDIMMQAKVLIQQEFTGKGD